MSRKPIFIIGALNRTGTNFLSDIIELDPSYEAPKGIGEDYFLFYSNYLESYTFDTIRHWGKEFRDKNSPNNKQFLKRLASIFLDEAQNRINTNKTLVTKTPRTNNLQQLFKLYPDCKVILLVRDGRDTVESFSRSFKGYNFVEIIRLWAQGVNNISNFLQLYKNTSYAKEILLLKYEDILTNRNDAIDKLVQFCDLDVNYINHKKINNMPLRGSSTNRGEDSKELHWKQVEKTAQFNPLNRWEKWPFWKKLLFKYFAGNELIASKYEKNHRW